MEFLISRGKLLTMLRWIENARPEKGQFRYETFEEFSCRLQTAASEIVKAADDETREQAAAATRSAIEKGLISMPQAHVNDTKDKHGKQNVAALAANLLRGTASVLDGSNPLDSAEQYGPGTYSITIPAGRVGRLFVTGE